ncbi:MAG: helix-turn-helix domain-containing protein [Minicystis sp.]
MTIPPLRERRQEVEPLAQRFIERMAAQMKWRSAPALSDGALAAMRQHHWPGNIRELRNVMERAVVLSGGGPILAEHLRLDAAPSSAPRSAPRSSPTSAFAATLPPPQVASVDPDGPHPLAAIAPLRTRAGTEERARIERALDHCGGNQTLAAEILGISRRTLLSRLDLYGFPRPRKKEFGASVSDHNRKYPI